MFSINLMVSLSGQKIKGIEAHPEGSGRAFWSNIVHSQTLATNQS